MTNHELIKKLDQDVKEYRKHILHLISKGYYENRETILLLDSIVDCMEKALLFIEVGIEN